MFGFSGGCPSKVGCVPGGSCLDCLLNCLERIRNCRGCIMLPRRKMEMVDALARYARNNHWSWCNIEAVPKIPDLLLGEFALNMYLYCCCVLVCFIGFQTRFRLMWLL